MPSRLHEWIPPKRTNNGATCVEVMFTEDAVYLRNSLQRDAGTVKLTYEEWAIFVTDAKCGDYDL